MSAWLSNLRVGPYSVVAQWLQALLDPPLRMEVASHDPDKEEESYSTKDRPLDYLGFLCGN